MLISGKGKCFHVFGCISKNFPENIFWCLEKKKENTKQKPQPGKKIINDHITRSRSTARDRDLDRDRNHGAMAIRDRDRAGSRSRSRLLREIAIDRAIDRAIGLELELAISDWIFSSRLLRKIAIDGTIAISPLIAPSDWSWSSRSRTGSSPLSRALSHFPEML